MNYNNSYNNSNNNYNTKNHSFHWRSKTPLPLPPLQTTTSYAAATAFSSQSNSNQNNHQNQSQNQGVCSNCGKFGHLSYQCNHPTVSYGTIVYRVCPKTKQREYLMICRKDSFGYVDFIRGKYVLTDMDHVEHIFSEMSQIEHERIKNAESFNELWCNLWNVNYTKNSHKHEERMSKKKYETLKEQDADADEDDSSEQSTLTRILASSSNYPLPEWEFPKGRKEFNETEIECALREFEEETGIAKQSVQLIDNVSGFDENYVGTNYAAYKHRYFLAQMDYDTNSDAGNNNNSLTNFQQTEVSRLEWKTLDQCMQDIRPYHLEKKQLLKNIDAMLQQYLIV
jgi:8-oxo-dGTP pyrophosphatase MutT (NUDIX family)